jgi:hypothetical protein
MKSRAVRMPAMLLLSLSLIITTISLDKSETRIGQGSRFSADRLEEEELKAYDQPAEANDYFWLKRSPDGHSPVPVERYLEAIEHMKRMPQYSTADKAVLPSLKELGSASIETEALGAWTPLGPGNIGGRTRALLINPASPNIMYAAGVAGGVWKTTNGGASWTATSDLLSNIAVCSLAFDPTNTEVIYAGTGEGLFAGDNVRGGGIFKTTDGGASFTFLASTSTTDFHYVNDIVVSPNDNHRVYAATRTGVWRSDDGGASWTATLNPLGQSGTTTVTGGCLDLAIRTDRTTDYLFAACGTMSQSTVYRNTSAGDILNGTVPPTPWTTVLTETGLGRTTLAIAPSDQNIVYALASSVETGTYNLGLLAVFRSTTSGDQGTWEARVRNTDATKLNTVLLSNPIIALQSSCGNGSDSFLNQGWYDNCIAVDPVDPNRVWVGGIDLFRSDDGGASWGIASYWWASKTDPHFAHADQHSIVFHPQYDGAANRTMFVTNDGGVFRTDNARAATAKGTIAACNTNNTSVVWTSLNNNYGVTQFYQGLPYPGGRTYLGGTQDNGTLSGSDDSGARWSEVFGGDGGYVAVDPTSPDTVYVETTRLSIRRSVNGGQTFQGSTSGINEPSNNFMFINPFYMDPSIPQRLWTGGRIMWRTNDAGVSWTQANTGVLGGTVGAIAIAEADSNYVLAGTGRRFASDVGGFIHRTSAALTSTGSTDWPATQPRTGFVSWLAFDPGDVNVAYATYSTFGGTHVWKSTDAGANWTGIDGAGDTGIPDIPVHSIVVDPASSQTLYIGTDIGVFISLNGGATWARENTGFANVVTESLAVASQGGTLHLFAFTHGRGAWRVPLGPAVLRIKSASVVGKKLLVFGQGIQDGARLLLNGEQQKTINDESSPTTNLNAKKAGKKVSRGQTVMLRLRNPDGTTSPEFRFMRP